MPKRKWNRLHDDPTIDEERHRRSQALKDQQEARATVDEALVELAENPPVEPDEHGAPRVAGPDDDAEQAADARRSPPRDPRPARGRRQPSR